MRTPIVVFVVSLLWSASALAEPQAKPAFDWSAWQALPVQDGGRRKPLDTLAWETLRTIGNRASVNDPKTGQKLSPTAFYLAIVFDWQGWDHPAGPHAMMARDSHSAYFRSHKADKWDRAALLRLDDLELREALGFPTGEKHVSPLAVSEAKIRDPHSGREAAFLTWAEKLARSKQDGFTTFEKRALELADKFWSYEAHRMGERLEVLPLQGSEHQEWLPVAYLMRAKLDEAGDPTGKLKEAQEQFRKARAAYRDGSPQAFNQASAAFLAAVGEAGPKLGDYPDPATINLEVTYNHWTPFRFAWVFTLAALVGVLLSMGLRSKTIYAGALGVYIAGLLVMCIGFTMRTAIAGRVPVTNMYESVVYVGLGIAVLGLIFELIHRKRYVLAAAAAVSTVTLILADNCPAVLDPGIRPLPPVLRSNFWLATHVLTITLSYAAFALALGIANITLGFFLADSRNRDAIEGLSRFTYKTLQVGVLFLVIGTILGAVWARYAWGRFWGWDPKEVWALITLLGYLALLHARYIRWVGQFGLAAASVACFALVVMAWYGVNFVLGTGLHSYGFGGGGQTYVAAVLLVQFLYVGAAAVRFGFSKSTTDAGKVPASEEGELRATRNSTRRAEQAVSQ